jgi:hypothetical protein
VALTSAQLTALKNDIAADGTLSQIPHTSDGAFDVAAAYNLAFAPDFWVWKTSITKHELVNGTGPDGTVFNWTGAGFITRSQGERDAFAAIFNSTLTCNPSLPQVRQAFGDIFSGNTAPAPANRTHLLAIARRKATRAERLFAAGTGSTASPGTLTFEGTLSFNDVLQAWNS